MSQTLTLEPHSIKSPQGPFYPEVEPGNLIDMATVTSSGKERYLKVMDSSPRSLQIGPADKNDDGLCTICKSLVREKIVVDAQKPKLLCDAMPKSEMKPGLNIEDTLTTAGPTKNTEAGPVENFEPKEKSGPNATFIDDIEDKSGHNKAIFNCNDDDEKSGPKHAIFNFDDDEDKTGLKNEFQPKKATFYFDEEEKKPGPLAEFEPKNVLENVSTDDDEKKPCPLEECTAPVNLPASQCPRSGSRGSEAAAVESKKRPEGRTRLTE